MNKGAICYLLWSKPGAPAGRRGARRKHGRAAAAAASTLDRGLYVAFNHDLSGRFSVLQCTNFYGPRLSHFPRAIHFLLSRIKHPRPSGRAAKAFSLAIKSSK
ncbi:MAG: hypothetical protein V4857_28325 [Pseudomonadota bacterium]